LKVDLLSNNFRNQKNLETQNSL